MLKAFYESLDAIPEAHRDLYKETDGKWHLQVEGMVAKEKVTEFRDNNVALAKENKTLKASVEAYGAITPDQAKELWEKKEAIESGKAPNKEAIDKAVAARVEELNTAHKKQVDELMTSRDSMAVQLEELTITDAVVNAGTKHGLKASAKLDITMRARQIFKLKDGKPVALQPDGETPIYGKDGVTALTIDEWAEKQREEAPHLFGESKGSGAPGGGSGGTTKTSNPWKAETRSLTRQGEIVKADPKAAVRLIKEAGLNVPPRIAERAGSA